MAMAKARTRGAPDLGAIEWAERAMPPGVGPELEGLGTRRRRFLLLYLFGPQRTRLNATRSAEAAGFAWPRQQGPRLMQMHGFGGLVARLFIKHCLPGGVDPTRTPATAGEAR
jgi:hypothetical protein